MEDTKIIELYWARNEQAIRETDAVYGKKLHTLADNIVKNYEDAEESVNDTYFTTWNTIPPTRPNYFFAYLAKICRNFAFGKLDWNNAAKRKAEVVTLTAEMERCIPDNRREWQAEGEEIGRALDLFLDSLSLENRLYFMRRYWYGDSITGIAERFSVSESKVKVRLHRMREKLRQFLDKEGIDIK